jgi:membrane-associated phospholipid phosphatase
LLGVPVVSALLAAAIYLGGSNQPLFLWLNRLGAPAGEVFWSCVTVLGDALVAITLLAFVARRYPQAVWAVLLASIFALVWTHGFKQLLPFPVPRPAAVLSTDSFQIFGRTLRQGSFPSGHATTVFTLAGVWIAQLAHPGWRAAVLALAVVVAGSRVMVGAHWPLDVLMGAFGGWLAAALGMAWARRWPYGLSPAGRVTVATLLTVAAVSLFFINTGYPRAVWLQYGIAAVTTAFALRELVTQLRAFISRRQART